MKLGTPLTGTAGGAAVTEGGGSSDGGSSGGGSSGGSVVGGTSVVGGGGSVVDVVVVVTFFGVASVVGGANFFNRPSSSGGLTWGLEAVEEEKGWAAADVETSAPGANVPNAIAAAASRPLRGKLDDTDCSFVRITPAKDVEPSVITRNVVITYLTWYHHDPWEEYTDQWSGGAGTGLSPKLHEGS